MDYIDLHIHTNASDGSFSQSEVIEIARRKGLRAIAITDHDTAGRILNDNSDIEVISGIEISADYQGREIHVLGYYINPDTPELVDMLTRAVLERDSRNEKIIARLEADGYPISLEELKKAYPDTVIGRPHIAGMLVKRGVVGSVNEAFDNLLGEGKPYYIPRFHISVKEAADVIIKAGGGAVLAHPGEYDLCDNELMKLIELAKQYGFIGLEAIHPDHTAEETEKLISMAKGAGMLITGGSDFHGKAKPDIDIGCVQVPYDILNNLKIAMKSRRLLDNT